MELGGTLETHFSPMDCFSDRCQRYFSVHRVQYASFLSARFCGTILFKNNNPHWRAGSAFRAIAIPLLCDMVCETSRAFPIRQCTISILGLVFSYAFLGIQAL